MAEYIYLPVPTKEMIESANKIVKARVKSKKPPPGILRNHFVSGILKGLMHLLNGCLRCVHHNDTLYLVLHGTGEAGGKTIGARRGSKMKAYTPEHIARTMQKEGLPKSFVDLHLLTCGGGLEGGNDVDKDLRESFAGRVSKALKDLGYTRIRVTGYLGDINPGAGDGFMVQFVGEFDNETGTNVHTVDDTWRRTIL